MGTKKMLNYHNKNEILSEIKKGSKIIGTYNVA